MKPRKLKKAIRTGYWGRRFGPTHRRIIRLCRRVLARVKAQR